MSLISPIDQSMQQQVIDEVTCYCGLASLLYEYHFTMIPVTFDLRGKVAGMYCVKGQTNSLQRSIRFNPWLFAKYPDDSWQSTIPHEVAHYIVDCLYSMRAVRPHGKEWKKVMVQLGAKPDIYGKYNLGGIPVRQMKRYAYQCGCRHVMLSAYRHHKIQRGQRRYCCCDCATELKYAQ
ncbi:hypothetical protein AB835_12480 [Candidatus Endobugula sertula]|uniref:SprT-like domain-containing protein n=1 Tax=Candidatus Endobugula sertula TaxID=62101 RepID=A0A1D2QME4_9GAMM|nr:hypothetical protein AB835_12480 [Candidatus Endobugula sertula]